MDNKGASLVVMAAGMGSRFGGLKQLARFGKHGETLLDYSIYDAIVAGFDQVVFIIRKEIENEFRQVLGNRIAERVRVIYVFQDLQALPDGFNVPSGRTKPWGTGQAVLMAKKCIQGPFVVINGDDFYGRDAFQKAFLGLSSLTKFEYLMIGYTLEKTLSDSGSVSRGICDVSSGGHLVSLSETHEVIDQSGSITGVARNEPIFLSGKETVSMNLFGFETEFFDFLESAFESFLKDFGQELDSEFYLPSVITDRIQKKEISVSVLPTHAEWFGVTYSEDVELVKAKILDLVDQGNYPSHLWV